MFDTAIRLRAADTIIGKSKELSTAATALKEHIIGLNKSIKSLGAISKHRSQEQLYKQLFVNIKCMAQLCLCQDEDGNKLSPAAERNLVRMVKIQLKTLKSLSSNFMNVFVTSWFVLHSFITET